MTMAPCRCNAGHTSPTVCPSCGGTIRPRKPYKVRDAGMVEAALKARPVSIREQHADRDDDPSEWQL